MHHHVSPTFGMICCYFFFEAYANLEGSNHRKSDDEQGVYNHLQNAQNLGSVTILKNDWIPDKCKFIQLF